MDYSKPPADSVQIVHLTYQSHRSGDIYTVPHMVGLYESVSVIVRTWLESDTSELLDFRVDTYALIPF